MARRLSFLVLVCTFVFLGVGAMGATAAGKPARTLAASDQLESGVLDELNAIRVSHGLVPVRLSRTLSAAADAHSRSMGTFGYFEHESRDGSAFWKRIQRFYGSSNYGAWSVGENLLWTSGRVDASAALKLWMESPAHRANILTARWREVGLSAVSVPAAPGVFGGRDVVIITSDFGARS
jgi:uncharacterized protein YkwD